MKRTLTRAETTDGMFSPDPPPANVLATLPGLVCSGDKLGMQPPSPSHNDSETARTVRRRMFWSPPGFSPAANGCAPIRRGIALRGLTEA